MKISNLPLITTKVQILQHKGDRTPVNADMRPIKPGDGVKLIAEKDQYIPSKPTYYPGLVYEVVGKNISTVSITSGQPGDVIAVWEGSVTKV